MKKKIITLISIIAVVALIVAGGLYAKDKFFSKPYDECFELIHKIEKQYDSQGNIYANLDKAVKKYAPEAKVAVEEERFVKYENVCKNGGAVFFYFNGDQVVGTCTKHQSKHFKYSSRAYKVYHDALHVASTLKDGVVLNNESLQEATFYYENGLSHMSYPKMKINGQEYSIVPYYDEGTHLISVLGVKNFKPFENDGQTLKYVTDGDAYYDYDHQEWYITSSNISINLEGKTRASILQELSQYSKVKVKAEDNIDLSVKD